MSKQNDITMALVDGPDMAFMANVGASFEDLVNFLADGRGQPEPPALVSILPSEAMVARVCREVPQDKDLSEWTETI